jgi:hypothetical protein
MDDASRTQKLRALTTTGIYNRSDRKYVLWRTDWQIAFPRRKKARQSYRKDGLLQAQRLFQYEVSLEVGS